jgi:UbiD family decarboxylase
VIAVDDDIDITDIEAVFWAMAWRVQPHRDTRTKSDSSSCGKKAPMR